MAREDQKLAGKKCAEIGKTTELSATALSSILYKKPLSLHLKTKKPVIGITAFQRCSYSCRFVRVRVGLCLSAFYNRDTVHLDACAMPCPCLAGQIQTGCVFFYWLRHSFED